MLINLQNTAFTLYLPGNCPLYTYYRFTLKSRYTNELINNDDVIFNTSKYFPLTLITKNDTYTKFTSIFNNNDIRDFDLEGFYDFILEGSNNNTTWIHLTTRISKVINKWNEINTDTVYVSNNDTNEQFVYYRE